MNKNPIRTIIMAILATILQTTMGMASQVVPLFGNGDGASAVLDLYATSPQAGGITLLTGANPGSRGVIFLSLDYWTSATAKDPQTDPPGCLLGAGIYYANDRRVQLWPSLTTFQITTADPRYVYVAWNTNSFPLTPGRQYRIEFACNQ